MFKPFFLFLVLGAIWAAEPASVIDDWPRYAHDKELTSHSSLKGKITAPETAWSYSMGGHELEIEILPAPGSTSSYSTPAPLFRRSLPGLSVPRARSSWTWMGPEQ